MIVCLWGYATYLNDHSTLAHHDRGGIHPTTIAELLYYVLEMSILCVTAPAESVKRSGRSEFELTASYVDWRLQQRRRPRNDHFRTSKQRRNYDARRTDSSD